MQAQLSVNPSFFGHDILIGDTKKNQFYDALLGLPPVVKGSARDVGSQGDFINIKAAARLTLACKPILVSIVHV